MEKIKHINTWLR